MTARFTSIDGAIINDPIIASLKQTSNGGTINMPTVASGSNVTLATLDDIPSSSSSSASSSYHRCAQAAMSLLLTYPISSTPYPTTFRPLIEKIRFSGWDNVTWTDTTFDAFASALTAKGTTIHTPDGVSLTNNNSTNMSSNISNVNNCSLIFGITRLTSALGAQGMFSACRTIKSLDLFMLDTSAVTSMSYMFSKCTALTDLDISNLDTSNVTNTFSELLEKCFENKW